MMAESSKDIEMLLFYPYKPNMLVITVFGSWHSVLDHLEWADSFFECSVWERVSRGGRGINHPPFNGTAKPNIKSPLCPFVFICILQGLGIL
jgi:hypothetical protein